jgi:hypothetical protein
MRPRSKSGFDCIEFKRRVQAEIYAEIKNLTFEKELEYWPESIERGPFAKWWKRLRRERTVGRAVPSSRGRSHGKRRRIPALRVRTRRR